MNYVFKVTRKIPQKPNSKLTPAQIMHNRFVKMQKQAQEEAERSVSLYTYIYIYMYRLFVHVPEKCSMHPKLNISSVRLMHYGVQPTIKSVQ